MDLVECTIEALLTMDCLFGVHRVPREMARVISKTIQWLSKPGGLFCPPSHLDLFSYRGCPGRARPLIG